ncbi:MAG TPA: hypothetical protein VF598_03025 [Hymenobacter sp.]|jgi:hypothetical protein
MNQHFNLTRFGRLFRKHITEEFTSYLLGTAVLLGGMVLVLGFMTYIHGAPLNKEVQGILGMMFLLAAGSFFASNAFVQFGAGRQAATALTLPASHLEKYLVAWVVSLPIFLVVFISAFYVADWLVMQLSALRGQTQPLIDLFSPSALKTLLLFLVVHGITLWGSIFFPKQQFIKTACGGLIVSTLLVIVNYQIVERMLGTELRLAYPFGSVGLRSGSILSLPESQSQWLLLPLTLAVLLWMAAYARLTEKQI